MDLQQFYVEVRRRFPAVTEKADRLHLEEFHEIDHSAPYSWFKSLANALNNEMNCQVLSATYEPLFNFVAGSLADSSEDLYHCVDVSFVENLFWQVSSRKAEQYWLQLPHSLRELYLDFHRRTPL